MNNNQKLASNLINYSCKLKKGEKVFIYVSDSGNNSTELVNAIIAEAGKVGAYAFPVLENPKTKREWLLNVTDEQLEDLKSKYPNYMKYIDKLSRYMKSNNKQYSDHWATICKWITEDAEKEKTKTQQGTKFSNFGERDYNMSEFEKMMLLAQEE